MDIPSDPQTTEECLRKIYYDLSVPGSFAGLEAFYRTARQNYGDQISKNEAKAWLLKNPAYFLYTKRQHRGPRNHTNTVSGPNLSISADLWDLGKFSQDNDDFRYVFMAVDIFSKMAYAFTMKSKDTDACLLALKELFKVAHCEVLFTDQESALKGKVIQHYLGSIGVHHQTSRNALHSFFSERLIRTFADRLIPKLMTDSIITKGRHRWLELLPDLVRSYNNSKHQSLVGGRYSPNEVSIDNLTEIYDYMDMKNQKYSHSNKPKFTVGDSVLISINDIDKFRKGYDTHWKYEFFKVSRVDTNQAFPMYTLTSFDGSEQIIGRFYSWEMKKIEPTPAMLLEGVYRSQNNYF
ncbi:MAG: transposase family protein [Desulfobulbaceae bacterium]|nr:transposase family protein [Desulfobulbaceae bacterium]